MYALLLILLGSAHLMAETGKGFMESDGKIMVVMAVVLIVLSGLLAFMVNVERKISKLEKEMKK